MSYTPYVPKAFTVPMKELDARYHIIGKLGSGSFGTVSLAKVKAGALDIYESDESKTNTLMQPLGIRNKCSTVAIKSMNRALERITDCRKIKELRFIWEISSHPSLVQVHEVFMDSKSFRVQIVMETMDQNLYQLMKARKGALFSPRTLKSILAQLACGVRHIHRHSFFHRDIKPENILVMSVTNFFGSRENVPPQFRTESYIVKLADYGLGRHVNDARKFTAYVSTRWYRSPEILLRDKEYYYPVDVWAFGCVMVEAATFRPLFPGSDELDQIYRITMKLGTPLNSQSEGEFPLGPVGGYWNKAKSLAANCGFNFPTLSGVRIQELVPRFDLGWDLSHLIDVVQGCLTWDPHSRASIYEVCSSAYFDGTVVRLDETNRDPSPAMGQPEVLAGLPARKTHNLPAANISAASPHSDGRDENFDYDLHKKLRRMPQIPAKLFKKESASSNMANTSSTYDPSTPELVFEAINSPPPETDVWNDVFLYEEASESPKEESSESYFEDTCEIVNYLFPAKDSIPEEQDVNDKSNSFSMELSAQLEL